MRVFSPVTDELEFPLPSNLTRRRPRAWEEWKALRRWGKLPAWEELPVGYLMREAREAAGFSQAQLARRLGCSQQAVARAERWESNPTVKLLRAWAEATGRRLEVRLGEGREPRGER